MSKSKEEQARREGMSYALRYAREHGLDALESDLKKRGAYKTYLYGLMIRHCRSLQTTPRA